jgi:hypothetical protein
MNREPKKSIEVIKMAIGDSWSDLASPDNGEHREEKDDDDKEQGMLSKDHKPGWVMDTITKTVLQRVDRIRQTQLQLGEMT